MRTGFFVVALPLSAILMSREKSCFVLSGALLYALCIFLIATHTKDRKGKKNEHL